MTHMKQLLRVLLIVPLMTSLLMTGRVHQAEASVCELAESDNWAVSAPGKILRGVINVGFGWTNLFIQPFKSESALIGIGKGFSDTFIRTLQGAGEIVIFFLPPSPTEPLHDCAFYDMGIVKRGD